MQYDDFLLRKWPLKLIMNVPERELDPLQ